MFDTKKAEYAHRKGHLRHGVAFVGMNSSLHDCDRDSPDRAQDKLAGVPGDRRLRKVRDLRVGDGHGILDLRGEVTEAGAKDECELWPQRETRADKVSRDLGLRICVCHRVIFDFV